MFNSEFFRDVLTKHVTEKAKHSAEGAVTVELHLQFGGHYVVGSIVDAGDALLIVDVYPETGAPKKTPAPERQLGAPLFELDRIAIAYTSISQVVITTRKTRKDTGFHIAR